MPIVNANVTNRNREQARRICELIDRGYLPQDGLHHEAVACGLPGTYSGVGLPNGSFTLDQVVGMLEAEGWVWFWQDRPFPDSGWINTKKLSTIIKTPLTDENAYRAPDLTAAMDALIKVLEAKS
jgi:hypothetical protein